MSTSYTTSIAAFFVNFPSFINKDVPLGRRRHGAGGGTGRGAGRGRAAAAGTVLCEDKRGAGKWLHTAHAWSRPFTSIHVRRVLVMCGCGRL